MYNKKPLIIIGAGGHGRVLGDTAKLVGYTDISFMDDNLQNNLSVIGTTKDIGKYANSHDFFVAVGNNLIRQAICNHVKSLGAGLISLVHPKATVAENVKVGDGVAIMAGAVVNNGAVLGDGVIVNTCASVDHDCIVGDYSHVSVGAHLAGTVKVGSGVMIGAGATVINNVSLCDRAVIGAGAVVIKDVEEEGTYVGVPAKRLNK